MSIRSFAGCERGSTIVEFAMIVPFLLGMVIFVIDASIYFWTSSGLRHGAIDAARCRALSLSSCLNDGLAKTYAASRAFGIAASAGDFTITHTTCGVSVAIKRNYVSPFGNYSWFNRPINGSYCYYH